MLRKIFALFHTLVIISVLFLVLYFFFFDRSQIYSSFLIKFIVITMLTDFFYLVLHIFRKPITHRDLKFDPSKLTVVIACYNGQDIIEETIRNALIHVRHDQIIVVSDASTDLTAQTAYKLGVRVFVNSRNINKALTISSIMRRVETPYVLLLDDDTLIGKTFIPTSLLDEGYSAVAFNVMPVVTGSLINKIQTFEYRNSMLFTKSLRANTGTIGNISGAIGLFHTYDLMHQAGRHSGQFGGEDEQRTALLHIYTIGKGVTYTDALVETLAPDSPRALFRQRAFRWNLSLPELLWVYWKIIFGTKHHYLLKIEKAYQIFLYATDPLRIALVWISIFYPWRLLVLYAFYFFLTVATWQRLGRKDPLWVVALFPLYRSVELLCRIVAHFYWFNIKYRYFFRQKYHKLVLYRRVIRECVFITLFVGLIWSASLMQFADKTKILVSSLEQSRLVLPVPIDITQVRQNVSAYGPQKQTDGSAIR